jgi:hypothetical protein
MLKNSIAVIIGVATGIGVMAFIQLWLMYQVFDMPDSMIQDDPQSVGRYMKTIPMGAMILIVVSQFIGGWTASMVSTKISDQNKKSTWAAGIVILVLIISNLIKIPHPVWMDFCMPAAAVLGSWLAAKNTY